MAEEDLQRRDYRPGYGPKHHIPTVQQYRDQKKQQKEDLSTDQSTGGHTEDTPGSGSKDIDRWFSKVGDPSQAQSQSQSQSQSQPSTNGTSNGGQDGQNQSGDMVQKHDHPDITQSEVSDPKAKRKQMKKRKADTAEREVTDPVTHLPVSIRDFTDADLKTAGEDAEDDDEEAAQEVADRRGKDSLSRQGTEGFEKSDRRQKMEHQGMSKVFPPPDFQLARAEMSAVYGKAIMFGLGSLLALMCSWIVIYMILPSSAARSSSGSRTFGSVAGPVMLTLFSAIIATAAAGIIYLLQGWVQKKAQQAWEDSVWEVQRRQLQERNTAPQPEPTFWLNKLVGSIWPLINPDLFASVVDMLEDVMQASLPRMVRMVSVEDLGQGSESLRILGVKWLPRGAAGKSVSSDGDVVEDEGQTNMPSKNGASANGQQQGSGQQDSSKDANNRGTGSEEKGDKDESEQEASGLEAEDGEFINLEIAFAYRASDTVRKLKDRQRNAHLYMAFYLPGSIKIPVWVELKGLVGCMRVRLQLTPDPPFIALATITLLGQPKADINCTPLVKRGLDIMDLPLISNFVQSAIDAALNQYVAPKSLTLDLKAMLAGDDFKHDTNARGILIVRLHRAFDFKQSDAGIPLISTGSSDPYVSVGWAKFGKPFFSTRVMTNNMEPYWEEETFLTVGAEEIDAEEHIRLQLWDSDRGTADDDLGRIEVPLKELMKNEKSNGKLWKRTDAFEALQAGETMPGRMEWSVGYFSKLRLLDYQVAFKAPSDDITTVEQLKNHSYKESGRKLREANRDECSEADQLMEEDFENTCTEMITTSVPDSNFPSGILSIQIHQVVGLELERQSRSRDEDGGDANEVEEEGGEHVPDSYCTIIVNHSRIFKTRTKPKSSKPFFNAGTERFVRDWRNTNIMISARDARVHEEDPLLGIVNIDLGHLLRERGTSRINDFFPLAGGIGYGRMRISIVFRSIQLQPLQPQLGWEWGTIEVSPRATAPTKDFPHELRHCRIKVRTTLGKGRLSHSRSASDENENVWTSRKDRPIRVPVRKRYSSALVFEFRSSRLLLPDQSPAFAILWLQRIPDEEDVHLSLPVYRGDLKRAEANVLPESSNGDRVGTLDVTVRFWRGIGRWHGRLAKKSQDVADVMECLVCARDNGLFNTDGQGHGHLVGDAEWLAWRGHVEDDGGHDTEGPNDDASSDSDSDSDDDDGAEAGSTLQSADSQDARTQKKKANQEHEKSSHGPGGIMAEIKDYGRHKEQLHRRHRGLMQWKGPRTIKWMKAKAGHAGDKVKGVFEHHDRTSGIETEV